MILKSWGSIIMVLTMITFKSVICDCCASWSHKIPDEAVYRCYEESNKNCSEGGIKNFTILEENEEDGTVDVQFEYESNCKYNLELRRKPQIDNTESCVINGNPYKGTDYHSEYKYRADSEDSTDIPSCTKTGNIKLKYMTTGCYVVLLSKVRGRQQISTKITSKYFSFHNRKVNFLDLQTNEQISKGTVQGGSKPFFEVKHPFVKQRPNIQLTLKSNDNQSFNKQFKLSPSSDNSDVYNLCNGTKRVHTDDGNMPSCSVTNNDQLKCEFKNLDNGNYTIKYAFKNLIQCPKHDPSTFPACEAEGPITIDINPPTSATVQDATPKRNEIFFVIIGVGSAGVLLMVALVIHRIILNKRIKDTFKGLFYPEQKPTTGPSKVLLLYAKDADIVMETMKSFRKALTAEGLEVYDIYDTDQQKSINEDEDKWITDKLTDENMKIVIVQTYCGQILLKSSLPAERLYRNPTCYDRYFPYALSLIRATVNPNDYTKLFVINMGFNFERTNCSEFTFLSTSKRFGLPEKFTTLTKELREECTIDICQNGELEEFQSMCETMQNYIADPNYLTEVQRVAISYRNDEFDIEETFNNEVAAVA